MEHSTLVKDTPRENPDNCPKQAKLHTSPRGLPFWRFSQALKDTLSY